MAFPKGHTVDHIAFKCFSCGRKALRGNIVQIGAGALKMAFVKTCRNNECQADAEAGISHIASIAKIKKARK